MSDPRPGHTLVNVIDVFQRVRREQQKLSAPIPSQISLHKRRTHTLEFSLLTFAVIFFRLQIRQSLFDEGKHFHFL
jgi:hypothetical protein